MAAKVQGKPDPPAFEEGLAVACMALLVMITPLKVVTRRFSDQCHA